jgi:histone-binding protein RBBP4
LIITGSADRTVAVWDTRNLKSKLFTLKKHTDEVNQVKFSRHACNLLASGSSDRTVVIWDLSRIGMDYTLSEEEKRDGPAECVFIHGGHTAKISDLAWNLNERVMLASVAEDNIVQVWQPAWDKCSEV